MSILDLSNLGLSVTSLKSSIESSLRLPSNASVRSLNLSGNSLSGDAVGFLANILGTASQFQRLRSISVEWNVGFPSDEGAFVLFLKAVAQHPSIDDLNMKHCDLGLYSGSIEAVTRELLANGCRLRSLNLSFNKLGVLAASSAGSRDIDRFLSVVTSEVHSLHNLDMSGNGLSEEALEVAYASCTRNLREHEQASLCVGDADLEGENAEERGQYSSIGWFNALRRRHKHSLGARAFQSTSLDVGYILNERCLLCQTEYCINHEIGKTESERLELHRRLDDIDNVHSSEIRCMKSANDVEREKLVNTISQYARQVAEHERLVASVRDEYEMKQETARHKYEELERRLADQDEQLAKSRAEVKELECSFAKEQSAHMRAIGRCKALEDDKAELVEDVDLLKSEKAAIQARLSESGDSHRVMKATVERFTASEREWEAERQAFVAKESEMRRTFDQKLAEVLELNRQTLDHLNEVSSQERAARERIRDLEGDLGGFNDHLKQKKDLIEKLQSEILSSEASVDKVRRDTVDQIRQATASLHQGIQERDKRLVQLEMALAEKANEVEQLKARDAENVEYLAHYKERDREITDTLWKLVSSHRPTSE